MTSILLISPFNCIKITEEGSKAILHVKDIIKQNIITVSLPMYVWSRSFLFHQYDLYDLWWGEYLIWFKRLTSLCSLGCLFELVELHHQLLLLSLHVLLLSLDGLPPLLLALQLIPAEHIERRLTTWFQILMFHLSEAVTVKHKMF